METGLLTELGGSSLPAWISHYPYSGSEIAAVIQDYPASKHNTQTTRECHFQIKARKPLPRSPQKTTIPISLAQVVHMIILILITGGGGWGGGEGVPI